MKCLIAITAITLALCGCRPEKETTLFELVDDSGIDFENNLSSSRDFNVFSYRNFYNGGGVAIADLNNDGLSDVFMTANMGSNKLYFNKGDFQFEDVTTKAGIADEKEWSTGVAIVDLDNDGWLDIYVCNAGYVDQRPPSNKLYINNRDGSFTDRTADYGLSNTGGYCTHAAFFDYDMDGDLDVFIINNSFIPVNTLDYANKRNLRASEWPVKDFLKGGGDRLLKNENGKFVDVSKEAGIYGSLISFGLGVTVGDVNGDHYPDVYVSNDFFERDYLYINQQNGTFKEDLENRMQHVSLSSMGADIGDVNNDGYPDLFTTDMLPDDELRLKTTATFESIDVYRLKLRNGFYHQYMQNSLQVNNGNGKFYETAYYSGVAASDWSWGALLFDADNDGLNDLFVSNGIYHDVTDQDFIDFFADDVNQRLAMTGEKEDVARLISRMPSNPIRNKFYRNKGNLRFEESAAGLGLHQEAFSNGSAYGDLDNDGDLDLVVNNVNGKSFVYRNNSRNLKSVNHYIGFSLQYQSPNLFGIGSSIHIFIDDQVLTRELIPSRGFQSSVDYKILAGLGARNRVDSVVITWPDRKQTLIKNPAIDSIHKLSRNGTPVRDFVPYQTSSEVIFKMEETSMEAHQEDDYVDFYMERNIPFPLSKEGPAAAVADINGDGVKDVFIGGASGYPGRIYFGTAGGFSVSQVLSQHADHEDVFARFADLDGDGNPDLVVASGGNNRAPGSSPFQARLYRNLGNGKLEYDPAALPPTKFNSSVVAVHDVDGDGDLDLFIGSRSVPQDYGTTPSSYLFLNDGRGRFTNATSTHAPLLETAGMVTGAVWVNLDGKGTDELVVTTDWGAPRIFTWQNNQLIKWESDLDILHGCWLAVDAADLDNDGDQDLVLGNMGENSYLQASASSPLRLWINDFDDNGVRDKIITRTRDGQDIPVFMKRDLTDQLPGLKKQNLKHSDYAGKKFGDLFPTEKIQKAEQKFINTTTTIVALNQGNNRFQVVELPMQVQWSSVRAICISDINGDGAKDLLLGGNSFGFLPQFSRLDASYGHLLLNKGKGRFEWIKPSSSGLELNGEMRAILPLKENSFLVVQNSRSPVLLRSQK